MVTESRKGVRSLAFMSTDTLKVVAAYTFDQRLTVIRYGFVNGDRVVVELGLYVGDRLPPISAGEIQAINIDGSQVELVFGHRRRAGSIGLRAPLVGQDIKAWGRIVDLIPADERHILVLARPWESERAPTRLYRVDALSGRARRVGEGPGSVDGYLADGSGRPVAAYRTRADFSTEGWVYDDRRRGWQPLADRYSVSRSARPVHFASGTQTLYVFDALSDRDVRLRALSLRGKTSKAIGSRFDASLPGALLIDDNGGAVVGWKSGAFDWAFAQPRHPLARWLKDIKRSFKGAAVDVKGRARDGAVALVSVTRDSHPPHFYLVRRDQAPKLLFESNPRLKDAAVGRTKPFRFRPLSGAPVDGFLTLPPDRPTRGLPVIVMPSASPVGVRSLGVFDPYVQAWAAIGYGVLQVNPGPGYPSPNRVAQVAGRLVAAARWAVHDGLADPERIGLVGFSVGAWAAVRAAVLAPDLFRCVVAWSGLYAPQALAERAQMRRLLTGHAFADDVIGGAASGLLRPSVFALDRLLASVLIIHGTEDPVAPLSHAKAFRDALDAQRKDVEWLRVPSAGHGFARHEERVAAAYAAIAFVSRRMPMEPIPPPVKEPGTKSMVAARGGPGATMSGGR